MKKRAQAYTWLLALFLLGASIWYLSERFDWRTAYTQLATISYGKPLTLILVTHVSYICVRTYRWLVLVRDANPDVRFTDLYMISAVSVSLAIATPAQIGELIKIEASSRSGLLKRVHGYGAYLIERTVDALVLSAMCLAGVWFDSGIRERYPELLAGSIVVFGFGLSIYPVVTRILPNRMSNSHFQPQRHNTKTGTFILTTMLTVLSWMLIASAWQISLSSVGIMLPATSTMILVAVVTVAGMLSFVPAGLGVADVMSIEVLMVLGVSSSSAQAAALALRAYALVVILFGLFHLLLAAVHNHFTRQKTNDTSNKS